MALCTARRAQLSLGPAIKVWSARELMSVLLHVRARPWAYTTGYCTRGVHVQVLSVCGPSNPFPCRRSFHMSENMESYPSTTASRVQQWYVHLSIRMGNSCCGVRMLLGVSFRNNLKWCGKITTFILDFERSEYLTVQRTDCRNWLNGKWMFANTSA